MLSLSYPMCRPSLVPTPSARPRVLAAAMQTATMYELLSVAETAGQEEIKAAYRREARRWHPDACRVAGNERRYAESFIRAREAYEVLSDPVRRRHYDLVLSADRGAAAIGANAASRAGGGREGARARKRIEDWDWEGQLQGLQRRSAAAAAGGEGTWAGRMRRARQTEPSI
nr:PREDICTED: chaperone protein dnaJ 20, chloroplastic-like [Musa acuminata subsp. malaccensis]